MDSSVTSLERNLTHFATGLAEFDQPRPDKRIELKAEEYKTLGRYFERLAAALSGRSGVTEPEHLLTVCTKDLPRLRPHVFVDPSIIEANDDQ